MGGANRRIVELDAGPHDGHIIINMDLGAFSISLAVKDIEASRAFYEKLGFEVFHGSQEQNWLMMKNREHVVGLFQGMFEHNILTFNPGWGRQGQPTAEHTDVRQIQRELKAHGISD